MPSSVKWSLGPPIWAQLARLDFTPGKPWAGCLTDCLVLATLQQCLSCLPAPGVGPLPGDPLRSLSPVLFPLWLPRAALQESKGSGWSRRRTPLPCSPGVSPMSTVVPVTLMSGTFPVFRALGAVRRGEGAHLGPRPGVGVALSLAAVCGEGCCTGSGACRCDSAVKWTQDECGAVGPGPRATLCWGVCVCAPHREHRKDPSGLTYPPPQLPGMQGGGSRLGDQTSGFSLGSQLPSQGVSFYLLSVSSVPRRAGAPCGRCLGAPGTDLAGVTYRHQMWGHSALETLLSSWLLPPRAPLGTREHRITTVSPASPEAPFLLCSCPKATQLWVLAGDTA